MQALNLLNDPVFVQAAQATGLKMMAENGGFKERLRKLFLLTLARTPSTQEAADLQEYYEGQLAMLRSDAKTAQTIMPATLMDHESSEVAAAWAAVASVVLNTDEFITRE